MSKSSFFTFSRIEFQNGIYLGAHKSYSKELFGAFFSDDNLFYLGININKKKHFEIKLTMCHQYNYGKCS